MEIIHLSETHTRDAAKKAARALESGELIIYPTDTLYGIGADVSSAIAVQRLRELKGRNSNKPISVIMPNVRDIHLYAEVNEIAQSFIDRFLPGPLTIVLPAKSTISANITMNGSIGVRVPNNPFTLELGKLFAKPYTATSANRSGRETPHNVHAILQQFGHDIHDVTLAIDDGDRLGGVGSTIISCLTETPHMLREGLLSKAELGIR
jgi:L-threonylcarbamoyladenylate synthase